MADDKIVFNEETDGFITFDFKDKDGVNMTAANVATLLMTIYETNGDETILAQTDVRNGGAYSSGVTIGTGTMTIRLQPAYNAIVGNVEIGKFEEHTILIEGTTSGTPSYAFSRELTYKVENVNRVT